MKSKKSTNPSFFDTAQLTILPISFDHPPTEAEFANEVVAHANTSCFPLKPKDPKSSVVWIAFPNQGSRSLFYVCFPSTVKGAKTWLIGMSDKGDISEAIETEEYLSSQKSEFHNNSFDTLQTIKETLPEGKQEEKMTPALRLYLTKCPCYSTVKPEIATAIWKRTFGNPCRSCNRPADCSLTIYSKHMPKKES